MSFQPNLQIAVVNQWLLHVDSMLHNLIVNNTVPHHELLLPKSNDVSKFLDRLWFLGICKTPLHVTMFSQRRKKIFEAGVLK